MGIAGKLKKWLKLWENQFSLRSVVNQRCADRDSVLVIKLDAIGDFIIWLDSAKEYQRLFSGKKCILLCNALCGEIAAAAGNFDEIRTLDIKRFEEDGAYREEQIRAVSEWEFGTLIQTAYSRTQHMDLLAAAIPAHRKIGFEADESRSNLSRRVISRKNRLLLDRIYDQLIPATRQILMELQRNAEFLRGLGDVSFRSAIPRLPEIGNVTVPQHPYFLVFPGASTSIKMWSPVRFAEVIDSVLGATGWQCLICGGGNETYLYQQIAARVRETDRLENRCGKTSLTELIELVRHAKLVLSNDTSGIHFAAATGADGVCPFGEYNYGRFLPYASDRGSGTVSVCSAGMKCRNCAQKHMTLRCLLHVVFSGRYLCLDMVRPEDVKRTVFRIIEKKENSQLRRHGAG